MTDSDQPQRFCTQCGAQVRSGTTFCSSCGAPLTTSTGSSENTADDSPPKSAGPGLGAAVQALPNRAREFWSQLDKRVKWGLLGILLIGLLALLSPIAKWLSIVALTVSVLILVVQAVRREPLKLWGISSATLLILVLAFSGLSSAVYGGGLFGGSAETEQATETGSGDYNGDEQSNLSYEEEQYLTNIVGVYNEIAEITDRQVDIYNYCLEVCDPESYSERTQNMQESSDLLDEAYDILPPSGYENVDDSIMSAMETADDLIYRIALDTIGGTEADDMMLSINDDLISAYDYAPTTEAQNILEQVHMFGEVNN